MSTNTLQPSKSKPVLFSLLTLLSGIIIGAAGMLLVIGLPPKEPAPPLPEEFSRRMVERMTRELTLTAAQQEAIGPVVETHMKALDAIRDEARPRIRQELETMNNEILALLDEPQQQMWKDHIERMQHRFREFRERRGPGRPGDGPRRRDGDWRGRDRDDRDPNDRGRSRRGDGPGRDPNSPFFRRPRSGEEMPGNPLPPQDEPF